MGTVTAYIRENYKKQDGTTPIYCKFYINRQKIRIPVGISVNEEQWDEEGERIKGTSKEVKDNNLIIRNVKSKINNIFVKYRLEERKLTKEIFVKEYNTDSTFENFWDFMEFQIKKRKGLLAKNTYNAQISTLNKLKEVLPNLQFHEMNEEAIRDIKKLFKTKFDNKPNTIAKNLITLKTYVSIAVRKKYIDQNPFSIEKIKRVKPDQVWLNEAELKLFIKAYNEKVLPENMHRILQYFLFSCFTGLRLNEVKNFRMEQIKGSAIILNPKKTKNTSNEMVTIELTNPIKKILKDVAPHRVEGIVFDTFADQVNNRMLKQIAKSIGVNKDVKFHSARHTFATYFLEKTDDLVSLQKLLGHSRIEQTMVYVHFTEKKKAAQMHKCWDSIKII